MPLTLLLTLLALAPPVELPATRPAEAPETGDAVYAGDTVIFGYDPDPALVVPQNPVEAARFPAVDVHCHWPMEIEPEALLAAMDATNVQAAVNLSGGRGEDVLAMLRKFHDPHPDRLLILYTLSLENFDGQRWVTETVADFERAVRAGASGMKVWKDLGLTALDADGGRIAIDDDRLAPLWDKAAELGVPVLIHSSDPHAFFDPVDEHNERWMQLHRHPGWSFHGPLFPNYRELLAEHDRLIAKYPKIAFVGAHMAGDAEDLATLSARMKKLPNLYVDISGRVAELGRQPFTARKFLLEHQDRVLFGTDRYPGRPDQPRYKIYFRFLETADEYFKYYDHPFPPTGDWRIYGVDLPDEVLEKVYNKNAAIVFGLRGNNAEVMNED